MSDTAVADPSQRLWRVYLRGHLVAEVWFDGDMNEDAVRRSLIDNDGLSPAIEVEGQ